MNTQKFESSHRICETKWDMHKKNKYILKWEHEIQIVDSVVPHSMCLICAQICLVSNSTHIYILKWEHKIQIVDSVVHHSMCLICAQLCLISNSTHIYLMKLTMKTNLSIVCFFSSFGFIQIWSVSIDFKRIYGWTKWR